MMIPLRSLALLSLVSFCFVVLFLPSSCPQLAFGKFGRGRYGAPGYVPPATTVR